MKHVVIRIAEVGDAPLFPEFTVSSEGELKGVGILEKGMRSGAESIGLVVESQGKIIAVQISAAMLENIAAAAKGAALRFKDKQAVKAESGFTTNPSDPDLNVSKGPGEQNKKYLVLSEEERAKGFVRPVRNSYVHRGKHVGKNVRPITDDEKYRYDPDSKYGYVAYAEYDASKSPVVGVFLTQRDVDHRRGEYAGGCGAVTKMSDPLAETYARNPKFYGATFCVGCKLHLPVNEFVWDGTELEVGS